MACDYRLDEPEFASISSLGRDFISRLLVTDPGRRMSAEEALQHPWMEVGYKDEEGSRARSRKTSYDRMRLRGFAARGRWQRCAKVIAAVGALRNGIGSPRLQRRIVEEEEEEYGSYGSGETIIRSRKCVI